MTSRQKLIVAILAIANVIIILILATLALRPSSTDTAPLPTPTIGTGAAMPSPMLPQEDCRWDAAQMLAQAGLGGTAALNPDGSLCLEITHSLPPGEITGEAAQLVWVAFDVALALQEQDCEFDRVEVTVLAARLNALGGQPGTRISASVGADDLAAFGAGELREDELIERVTYSIRNE